MKKILLGSLALLTISAQASVFKCNTETGVVYSETPCANHTSAGEVRVTPSSDQSSSEQHQTERQNADSNNLPLMLVLKNQHLTYSEFQAKPNPKAFVLCQDGRAMILTGTGAFFQQELSSLPAKCVTYAINDTVVWAGR
jgi:hypothetical protein